MSALIAALPMYDWPETRADVDARWASLRERLRSHGVAAPDFLVRRNADMPAVPGGIRNAARRRVASDPATLPPDGLDFEVLWRHPDLLFAQTCWGPLETTDLADFVTVLGQPDYTGIEGGSGALYSSAVVMRRERTFTPMSPARAFAPGRRHLPASPDGAPPAHDNGGGRTEDDGGGLPLDALRGKRFAFNSHDSMSGVIAMTRDLAAVGETMDIFSARIETGGHRLSIAAMAEGRADVATIDCLSWDMARRFEAAANEVEVVGWTARRKGLPFITSRMTPEPVVGILRIVLRDLGLTVDSVSC